MRKLSLVALAGIMSVGLVPGARAADMVAAPVCGMFGMLKGGGNYDFTGDTVTGGTTVTMTPIWSAYGDGAIDYGCNGWVFQADGAYYGHWASSGRGNFSEGEGHIGGAIFMRDEAMGSLGIAASRVFSNTNVNVPPTNGTDSQGQWRLGGFGEYYASDAITLGLGGHYITGGTAVLSTTLINQNGFEGELNAKFYPSNYLSLNLRGDLLLSRLEFPGGGGSNGSWNGFAISAEGEYLIPDTSLSLLADLRFASRDYRPDSGTVDARFTDTTVGVGVKYAFGATPAGSIRERDRHGSYDNTSMFEEKLPAFGGELIDYAISQ